MGCDTFVALPVATRDGVTLFAKNSDRPPRESQGIVQRPRRTYPAGATVRTQYLELPQVAETAALIGSQPYWLWGFEHGVNEHRVAIGNETVFSKEPLGPNGLLGMDLVRLGLERGRTAREAVDVITGLLAAYGQGGSGQVHLDWPYHNAFLVADPSSAWIVETSDRHWVARRVTDTRNISNGLQIDHAWDLGAADVTRFAVAQGWWDAAAGPVDFTAAYADDSGVPPNVCAERRRRGAQLLAEGRGALTVPTLQRLLRDHYDDGVSFHARAFDDPRFFSLCMHCDPLDNTTASVVAALPADRRTIAPLWVSLGSPCLGAFVPVYLEGVVPSVLGVVGAEPTAASPWWRMRTLLSLVERDPARFAPAVRAAWDAFEAQVRAESARAELAASEQPAAASGILTAQMAGVVTRYLALADTLIEELRAAE